MSEQQESNNKICDMFEKACNDISKALKNTAKQYNSESVPIELVEQYQKIYIDNLRESMNAPKNKKNFKT